ncbi:MAG: methylmalonyl-CoA epimerase [Candidatus Neomarinimicrobiota bacterium]
MKILSIEHVAIATDSLEETAPFWRDVLGIPHRSTEVVESEGVTIGIYDTGQGKVELLTGHGNDSPVKNFLKNKGPGLHHLCLGVEDIESAIKELQEMGIRLVAERPRTGSGGYRYTFIHPESTGGVLVELCELS